jgi:hypothetical protein
MGVGGAGPGGSAAPEGPRWAGRLRQFLFAFHDPTRIEAAQAQRAPAGVAYIPAEHAALQGLGRVNVALVPGVAAQGKGRRATLDHDATIQESWCMT